MCVCVGIATYACLYHSAFVVISFLRGIDGKGC